QVLTNLATNSARFTDTPGQVTLTVCQVDGHLVFYFDDSAPSVATHHLEKIFERLYRVEASRSRATGGCGLGLAICAGIVHFHGGEIYAEISPLGGIRVVIKLPNVG
ncbi:MAG: ATP-binding protein, partial [Psychrosphaera sp.]|nr:ATP-binding protein [Psychrosphaera sp.]